MMTDALITTQILAPFPQIYKESFWISVITCSFPYASFSHNLNNAYTQWEALKN